MPALNLEQLRPIQDQLIQHPIYASLRTIGDLRVFMSHHVFSVWDFMSMIKYLQLHIAPVQVPWIPRGDPYLRYCVNQFLVQEESDTAPGPGGKPLYGSHFEYYCNAMKEVGADGGQPTRFLTMVREQGLDDALYSDMVPLPSRYFTETTFAFIREDKPHEVAAALALGREQVIPDMFRRFLREMGVSEVQAPAFHYYLKRHVQLDEGLRGPLSMQLLEHLCGGDATRIEEAETAAKEAICARIRFWDGVLEAIETHRGD